MIYTSHSITRITSTPRYTYFRSSWKAYPSTQFSTNVAPCLTVWKWPSLSLFSTFFCLILTFSILLWNKEPQALCCHAAIMLPCSHLLHMNNNLILQNPTDKVPSKNTKLTFSLSRVLFSSKHRFKTTFCFSIWVWSVEICLSSSSFLFVRSCISSSYKFTKLADTLVNEWRVIHTFDNESKTDVRGFDLLNSNQQKYKVNFLYSLQLTHTRNTEHMLK